VELRVKRKLAQIDITLLLDGWVWHFRVRQKWRAEFLYKRHFFSFQRDFSASIRFPAEFDGHLLRINPSRDASSSKPLSLFLSLPSLQFRVDILRFSLGKGRLSRGLREMLMKVFQILMHLASIDLPLDVGPEWQTQDCAHDTGPAVPAVLKVKLGRELHQLGPIRVGVTHLAARHLEPDPDCLSGERSRMSRIQKWDAFRKKKFH